MQADVTASLADDVERFIRERFAVPDHDPGFGRDVDLWDQGYVDSVGVVELIAFLEARLDVKLPPDILFDPEFKTIHSIARLLTPHAQSAQRAAGGARG